MDRYAEQFWLTLFAKAPEITMFDYRQPDPTYRFEITIKPHSYRVFKTIDMK